MPGAELEKERSFWDSSSEVGTAKSVSSISAVGTWVRSSSLSWSRLQLRGPKVSVKKRVASSRVPSKPGLSSLKIFRAARFLDTR